eukprot:Nk52_evm74s164 gene=Nk52_evmTU74s164
MCGEDGSHTDVHMKTSGSRGRFKDACLYSRKRNLFDFVVKECRDSDVGNGFYKNLTRNDAMFLMNLMTWQPNAYKRSKFQASLEKLALIAVEFQQKNFFDFEFILALKKTSLYVAPPGRFSEQLLSILNGEECGSWRQLMTYLRCAFHLGNERDVKSVVLWGRDAVKPKSIRELHYFLLGLDRLMAGANGRIHKESIGELLVPLTETLKRTYVKSALAALYMYKLAAVRGVKIFEMSLDKMLNGILDIHIPETKLFHSELLGVALQANHLRGATDILDFLKNTNRDLSRSIFQHLLVICKEHVLRSDNIGFSREESASESKQISCLMEEVMSEPKLQPFGNNSFKRLVIDTSNVNIFDVVSMKRRRVPPIVVFQKMIDMGVYPSLTNIKAILEAYQTDVNQLLGIYSCLRTLFDLEKNKGLQSIVAASLLASESTTPEMYLTYTSHYNLKQEDSALALQLLKWADVLRHRSPNIVPVVVKNLNECNGWTMQHVQWALRFCMVTGNLELFKSICSWEGGKLVNYRRSKRLWAIKVMESIVEAKGVPNFGYLGVSEDTVKDIKERLPYHRLFPKDILNRILDDCELEKMSSFIVEDASGLDKGTCLRLYFEEREVKKLKRRLVERSQKSPGSQRLAENEYVGLSAMNFEDFEVTDRVSVDILDFDSLFEGQVDSEEKRSLRVLFPDPSPVVDKLKTAETELILKTVLEQPLVKPEKE